MYLGRSARPAGPFHPEPRSRPAPLPSRYREWGPAASRSLSDARGGGRSSAPRNCTTITLAPPRPSRARPSAVGWERPARCWACRRHVGAKWTSTTRASSRLSMPRSTCSEMAASCCCVAVAMRGRTSWLSSPYWGGRCCSPAMPLFTENGCIPTTWSVSWWTPSARLTCAIKFVHCWWLGLTSPCSLGTSSKARLAPAGMSPFIIPSGSKRRPGRSPIEANMVRRTW
jgi:hypothetical protein